MFAEEHTVYRDSTIRLDAVLANEDVLLPGEYPVVIQLLGPDNKPVIEKNLTVTIPQTEQGQEPPFAIEVFSEDVLMDFPAGEYRFVATFKKGAAAAGNAVKIYVFDRADMPKVDKEFVLWGKDARFEQWLKQSGLSTRQFDPAKADSGDDVIVISEHAAAPSGEAFGQLQKQIEQGATALVLFPRVVQNQLKDMGLGEFKGSWNWLYHGDPWTREHSIFDGLPAGGLMDYVFYRNLIPDHYWHKPKMPVEIVAATNNTSIAYDSGLTVAIYNIGRGRLIINTMPIQPNLDRDPVAEHLLRNMLVYAAGK